MTETHNIDIYSDNGLMFEDCPAKFSVEYEEGDPEVGESGWQATAEFVGCMFSALPITRDMLVMVLSRTQVRDIEATVADKCAKRGPD